MTAPEEYLVDVGRGIELCHDGFGDPADPPVVLIAGLGQQKHTWPAEFAAAHRRERATGSSDSTIATWAGRRTSTSRRRSRGPSCAAVVTPRQYHLGDMARDTVGLLDALGYRDAHLVGVSMGGMIAQTVAAHHPGRVRTLTSIMSTTGAPRIGRPAPSTWWRMATARPPATGPRRATRR